ncbi:murein L,D-transpeptidase catalytic domain family protein [Dyadobacter sp. CY345]|uniref:murein L,D-transpeptidase catalytic domain family protein n=1 Tax=Dyadobacter sp. CY345 TaxID=2909335 RepID=UPI001F473953|nr:murein L,D-transpeptidase catalytic domain family protein [Dyadobacter sp. CY345]MCF2442399.1 murein L,D-transpeptidase catalytic domain family protein [Dyadobacter sp. CY345]
MTKAHVVVLLMVVALSVSFGFQKITPLFHTNTLSVDTLTASQDSVSTPEWMAVYDSLDLKNKGLSEAAFQYAWYGYKKMNLGKHILAIADFSQSSCKKRLYVIDFLEKKLVLNTFVAHGRNSGQEYAKNFSNDNSSFQSSLGFYKTLGTYQGKHGLSLRLEGVEKGINDRAFERAIVMHGADYVSEDFIKNTGRLGRSQGCPAVSIADHKKLIQLMYNGAGLFIYSQNQNYFKKSSLLAGLNLMKEKGQALGASLLYTSAK